jgi:Rrf2 family protein
MVHLASRYPDARTTDQIAEATRVPKAYLSKVMQGLCRAGLTRSQRGIRGGMALAHKPEDITILEVVNAVDPVRRIKTCPLELASHGRRLCPLHSRLDRALADVERAFGSTTLAEILDDPSSPAPLCEHSVPAGSAHGP